MLCLTQGWPSFLCKAPTLLPTLVGCAINVGQGWPTFSVHAPKFFATQAFIWRCATQTFIAFHCSQTCSNIFILWSQNKAIFSGDLQKKKKKTSSPVSLHLFHHFWLKYATKREANQVRTFFFFFLEMLLEWQIFRPDERTLTQIARKILNLECATSKHAMRHGWPPLV